jgi:heme-degrading monooxygenase HmoA
MRKMTFAVAFELKPRAIEVYLDRVRGIRRELAQVDGLISSSHYQSLDRTGWVVLLSLWRNEKAAVRWRTHIVHHSLQEEARAGLLSDYRIRAGHIIKDSDLGVLTDAPDPFPEDEPGALTIITGKRPIQWTETSNAADCAEFLSLNPYAAGMQAWDLLQHVEVPDNLLLFMTWDTADAASEYERHVELRDGVQLRRLRVERDYGMFERDQAPQYFLEAQLGTDCD